MSATDKRSKTRTVLRSKWFWLSSLVLLYSVFGWVFVPMILDAQLKSILQSTAKWHTRIEHIQFNPYTFALDVKGTEIEEANGNPVLSFERLFVNFNLLETLKGTLSFDEITLDKPIVHVDLDQQGNTNFQRAFVSETVSPEDEQEESGEPLALFFGKIALAKGAVYFTDRSSGTSHQLVLQPLSLTLKDFSTVHNQGGQYALLVSLGKEIQGKKQSLKWQGQIGIAPFQSTGKIALNNIDSSTFWHYVKDVSPYWLNQATVSVSGDYHMASQAAGFQVRIKNTRVSVDDLVLSESEAGGQWLSLKQVAAAPVSFDLQAATLNLGQISLEAPSVTLQRGADQSLNILRPLAQNAPSETALEEPAMPSEAENVEAVNVQEESSQAETAEAAVVEADITQPETDQATSEQTTASDAALAHNELTDAGDNSAQVDVAEATPESAGFQWQLSEIRLNDGKVSLTDEAISPPANFTIEHLALQIGALSQDLSKAFPYELQFLLNDAEGTAENTDSLPAAEQMVRIAGELSPTPFKISGAATLPGIDLKLAQHYLSAPTNVLIENGKVSVQADYDLALTERASGSTMSGQINSQLRIDELALKDTRLNKSFTGFKSLELGPLAINLPEDAATALSIKLDNMTLDQFYADLIIAKNGEMNLNHLMKAAAEAPSGDVLGAEVPGEEKPGADMPAPELAASEKTPDTAPKVDFSLDTFTLSNARLNYSDASLTPAFATRLSELSGSIKGISSAKDAQSTVDFTGKLDSHSKLAIKGTLNPLSETPESRIYLKVQNYDLTAASPYSAKYAGYLIEKGKLGLDLDYSIKGSKIKAKNEVILKQFEFGKSVKSKSATSLPLPLAIGILKDRKGVIDLKIPISGDLNDPSFQIGSVLVNTFVNIITRVVTSPFSILGGLIEGGDKLSEVAFQANTSELDAEQVESVLKLAKALQERPKLSLEIRAIADANVDQIDAQVRPDEELIALAKARAQTLSEIIVDQGEIDSARVFILEPKVIPLKAGSKPAVPAAPETAEPARTVTTKFTLGVR